MIFLHSSVVESKLFPTKADLFCFINIRGQVLSFTFLHRVSMWHFLLSDGFG